MTSVPPPDNVPMIEAPPPMSGTVTDDHPGADPSFDHGGAQRPGVEVDESFVHDRGPGRQVGTEPHPVRVPDPDAGRHHVVDHPGNLSTLSTVNGPPWARAR